MNEDTKVQRGCGLALGITARLRIKPLFANDMFLTGLVNKHINNGTKRQNRKGNRNGEASEGSELGLMDK